MTFSPNSHLWFLWSAIVIRRIKLLSLAFVAGIMMSSCSGLGAEDKSVLSRPDMRMDANPLTSALDDHIYFSKEASSGGRGFGGGGCGCN